jgi:hypothetical protein
MRLALRILVSAFLLGLLSGSQAGGQATSPAAGVLRLRAASDGIAFVIQTKDRTLFLLTELSLLGDDPRQPGGPPCALDTGDAAKTLPCKVAYLYPPIGIAVLRADASDFPGAFPPLRLGDSISVGAETKLMTRFYTSTGTPTQAAATFEEATPPFGLKLTVSTPYRGTPVLDGNEVIGVITKVSDGHAVALTAEAIRLALSAEEPFKKLW